MDPQSHRASCSGGRSPRGTTALVAQRSRPRTPSATYCTARAARSTPRTRVTTLTPVCPRSRPIGSDTTSAMWPSTRTMPVMAKTRRNPSGSVPQAVDGDRAGDERNGHGDAADVAAAERLVLLGLGLTLARREHHLRRDAEQEEAAGNTEGVEADLELAQKPRADETERHQD